jgi:Tfp pilus assembly pilus retraction ATPase PilT
MYSMDDLLHLLHSDGADELRLHVGQPPILVLDGEPHPVESPAITPEEAEQFFQSLSDTRQRRFLREHGMVKFLYEFRGRAIFVIQAKLENGSVTIDIH